MFGLIASPRLCLVDCYAFFRSFVRSHTHRYLQRNVFSFVVVVVTRSAVPFLGGYLQLRLRMGSPRSLPSTLPFSHAHTHTLAYRFLQTQRTAKVDFALDTLAETA